MRHKNFDEAFYLSTYPDVKEAVKAGKFESGWQHFNAFGRAEGRLHAPGTSKSFKDGLTRETKLLKHILSDGFGIEIGPSHRPIASKRAGYKVDIVDHMDTDGLRAKYVPHGVDLQAIEEVDFVSKGEPLADLIGRSEYYDWIIASHVIEHIPDVISWLQQCEILLKTGGRLALIVPDKRFCFDHLQAATATGALIDAYHHKRTRPSPGQVFDHLANACTRAGSLSWSAKNNGKIALRHSIDEACQGWNTAATTEHYMDVHCWRFTPHSFRVVLSDLKQLKLISLSIVQEYDTVGEEFHVILEKGAEATAQPDRLTELLEIQSQR